MAPCARPGWPTARRAAGPPSARCRTSIRTSLPASPPHRPPGAARPAGLRARSRPPRARRRRRPTGLRFHRARCESPVSSPGNRCAPGIRDCRRHPSAPGRRGADGNLVYLGRNDFQVKIRGFRIELGEIEARLAACAGVREAVVIVREDQPGERRLVAYVVATPEAMSGSTSDSAPTADRLRAALSASLAAHMVPSAFIVLERMPLTPNRTLNRSSLPAPDLAALADGDLDDAPHAGLETALAAIWQDLLHLERVGRHADFFALGGHSLLAMRLVSRVRDATGLELSLRDIFGEPTLARMAVTLAQAGALALPPLLPVARDGALALSLAQQRLWLISQVDDAASSAYHLASALHLRGPLRADALCAALGRIVARHESLRTTFPERDGQPVQAIAAPAGAFALRHHDLRAIPVAGRDAALARIGEAEASQAFDLAHGPLIRGQLLCLADEEHVLLVTQHHLITDGWSVGIMVRELSALYDAFSKGRADPLPPLLFQYADYAAWQRQWCDGAVQQGQANYWRQQLQGAPALLEVPTDRPRPARQSYAGGSVQFQLPLALSAAVRQLARQHDATLYMTLLAAWACLLARVGGQDDVVIGTPVANRRRGEFEGLIGFFVNTLAIRIRLDADPSVAELLAQVKTTMVNA